MTEQLTIPAVIPPIPRIRTAKGSISLASLRPGDVLKGALKTRWCVLINSLAKRRLVVWSDYLREEQSYEYGIFADELRFIGRAKPRRWHAFLPKWLKRRICPFQRLAK